MPTSTPHPSAHQIDSNTYDVIVVGGGPAGSTLATLLAQRSRSVLVLERDTFPRYHIGESLISGIVPVMRELGLEEELDRRYPLKRGVSLIWGDDPDLWRTDFNRDTPYDHSWHVDRASFDKLLLDNARAHGVTVVEQARVVATEQDGDGTVTGVRYTHDGVEHHANASYVVDASGQARVISRNLTPIAWQPDLRNVAIWRYFDHFTHLAEPGDILIESVPGHGWMWGIPISEERLSVGLVMPADELTARLAAGATRDEVYDQALAASEKAAHMTATAIRVNGPAHSARDFSHVAETFHGPGWLAVGDAATFIDPLFSSGVWLATSGSWIAARALDAALDRPDRAPHYLSRYDAVYRQIMNAMLEYVRYFTDPRRQREDYFQKAEAATQIFSNSTNQAGFVALISGISSLPHILDFDPEEVELAAAS